MHKLGTKLLSLMAAMFALATTTAQAEGKWITYPGIERKTQVVLHFRREVELAKVPGTYGVKVSADNRFVLYVNGKRVAAGPARGDLAHWRYESLDLAPYLKSGHNVIAAEVWNAVEDTAKTRFQTAPLAQLSDRVAFWVEGQDEAAALDSDKAWVVSVQPGHQFSSPFPALLKALGRLYYAAGSAESIDGSKADWDWAGPAQTQAEWIKAAPALAEGEASPWHLQASALPQMSYKEIGVGKVVRTDFPVAKGFAGKTLVIPANTEATFLLDQSTVLSAYPELTVSGGKGAKITFTYSEALYDADHRKGDRSEVGDRQAVGVEDVFSPDGTASRTYRPLWWRTMRYLQIAVKTGEEPLVLNRLKLFETGYPFDVKGYFKSNDPQLGRIWQIGWQTLKVDAHETFMDSSYWEQLQYVGDTRLQALIVYGLSGDPRLPVQAIDAFANSQGADGMIQSAYPSSTNNVIPPFGLLWIGMMHDYLMNQPDTAVLGRNLTVGRKVLAWFDPYVASNGLLTMNPGWNFIDWAGEAQAPGQPSTFDRFPSYDRASKTSCVTSLTYLGALKDMAEIESTVGDPLLAAENLKKATKLSADIQNQCWDASRGLYADSSAKTVFSQHANALAVLYDVAPREKMKDILTNVTRANGTEAPEGLIQASYYFSWYLVRAFDHAGLGDHYLDMLQTWRDLTKLNFTTWPEQRGDTRSDTHAWSSHPTADLIGLVAGIRPDAPGYAKLAIAPHLGALTEVEAGAVTPSGLVSVSYRRLKDGRVRATVSKPKALPGVLEWKGVSYPLTDDQTKLVLP
jgi:alpha-L-rhamnosidase